ncbi:hypothetical protein TgHK011_001313 [Trichoderma gracile]|nr:hypothetical protein TgHK011_001313 [Trichoderma gracile]
MLVWSGHALRNGVAAGARVGSRHGSAGCTCCTCCCRVLVRISFESLQQTLIALLNPRLQQLGLRSV